MAGGQRVLVAGAAGFIGSHLCDALLAAGHEVLGVDNLSTGFEDNLAHLADHPRFTFLKHDVCEPFTVDGPLDRVLHLASPASPPAYLAMPLETLRVGSAGTERLLELAVAKEARLLLASTSEVYGDPEVHPQREDYWGHVNPVGLRSVYDEAKRYAESVTMAYHRTYGTDVRIARIFNTYGPRLRPDDGRVVSNFVAQALRNQPLTVYGDGSQSRSFCYVDDEVRGLIALLEGPTVGPVNIGNPDEFTVAELAELVMELTGTTGGIEYRPLPEDDPQVRRPDITLAREALGWEPTITLREGLERTIAWLRSVLDGR